MNSAKHCFRILPLTLSLGFLVTPSLPTHAQSKLGIRSASIPQRIIFQENFEPPGEGEPQDTSGAGSRDGLRCSQDEQPIRPLMPKRNYGLTLEEHPSIFVDLPETSARQVVLTFQDETGESYERAFLPIADRTGIVSFTLPADKPPLAVGKNYQWSLVVVCGETVQPDDPIFRGWVQRVARSPELERTLAQKPAIEQAVWYAEQGYWYDLLAVMAQARRSHPNDANLTKLWQDVLDAVEPGAIAP